MTSMGTVLVLVTLLAGFCLYTVMTLPKSAAPPPRSSAQPALKADQTTEKLATLLLEARTIEQQFHQQRAPAGVIQFEETSKNLLALALELEKNAKQRNDQKTAQAAAQIVQLVTQYSTSFRELVQAWEARGGTADAGLGQEPLHAGSVRKTRELEEALLQLGRAEQNYFAARNVENQQRLIEDAGALAKAAGESGLEASDLQALTQSITNYTLAFDRYRAVSLATADPALSAAFAAEQIKQAETMRKAASEMEKLIGGLNPPQEAADSTALVEQNKQIEELTVGVNNSFSALQARIKAISVKTPPPAPATVPVFGLPPQLSLMIIAGIWLAIVLLTLLLAKMLTASVTSPIQRMTDIAHRMAGQDDFSLTFPPEKNEFGGLASALNIAVCQLAAKTSGNQAAAAELTAKTTRLSQLIRDRGDYDTRIADAVADQEKVLLRIRTAVDQANTDAGHLRKSTGGLTEYGQAVRHAAAGCEQSVTATVETVQAVVQAAEQTASIIAAYTDLAEQTTVAALNAAIKATRAGAQGKEFSSVTAELDRLAKRSSETAKEITSLLNNMTLRIAAGEKLGRESRQALQHLAETSSTSLRALEELDKRASALQTGTGDTAALLAELGEISGQVDSLVREVKPLNKALEDALAFQEAVSGAPAGADPHLEDMVKQMMQDYPEEKEGPGLAARASARGGLS